MSEQTRHDIGTVVGAFPVVATQRERSLRPAFALPPESGRFSVTVPIESAWTPRRIARLFGVSLLDIDPALARDVRRAHVEYDRRRRARRRRRRA